MMIYMMNLLNKIILIEMAITILRQSLFSKKPSGGNFLQRAVRPKLKDSDLPTPITEEEYERLGTKARRMQIAEENERKADKIYDRYIIKGGLKGAGVVGGLSAAGAAALTSKRNRNIAVPVAGLYGGLAGFSAGAIYGDRRSKKEGFDGDVQVVKDGNALDEIAVKKGHSDDFSSTLQMKRELRKALRAAQSAQANTNYLILSRR